MTKINTKQSLYGYISNNSLSATFSQAGEVKGIVALGDRTVEERYEGDYEVTPSIYAQILETEGKYLKEDVVINEIPFAKVSNIAGGTTVSIG